MLGFSDCFHLEILSAIDRIIYSILIELLDYARA